jgi:5-methylcytosine-specific restriction endonuclease McrA
MSEVRTCQLCNRPLGEKSEKHHVVPKSKGGKETVELHAICHRKIHKVFTRTELADFASIEPLKNHPDIEKFINWLRNKPPDFYRRTR